MEPRAPDAAYSETLVPDSSAHAHFRITPEAQEWLAAVPNVDHGGGILTPMVDAAGILVLQADDVGYVLGEPGDTCPVTLAECEPGDIIGVTPCGHKFQYHGLHAALARSGARCPACRGPVFDLYGRTNLAWLSLPQEAAFASQPQSAQARNVSWRSGRRRARLGARGVRTGPSGGADIMQHAVSALLATARPNR